MIGPLAWELLYAMGVALKKQKAKKKTKKKKKKKKDGADVVGCGDIWEIWRKGTWEFFALATFP